MFSRKTGVFASLVTGALLVAACATSSPNSLPDGTDTATSPAQGRMGGGMGPGGGQGMHERMGQGQGMREGMAQGGMGGGGMAGEMSFDAVDMRDADQVGRGEEVYQNVCSACHSIDPPMNQAPPFSHVARHLRQEKESRDAFTAQVIGFVTAPSEDASVMPAHAIERFGLMPPQPLPEEMLTDVAAYMWTLTVGERPAMEGMRGGMGGRGGRMGGQGGG